MQILSGDTSGHSLELIRKALASDSTLWLLHREAGWAHEMRKEWSEAIRAYERAGPFSKLTSIPRADRARVLAITGAQPRRNLRREGARIGVYLPHVATVFAALGETDAAIEWIERSASQRHTGFPHALVEPGFDSLRHHPRFVALLRRYQLPL